MPVINCHEFVASIAVVMSYVVVTLAYFSRLAKPLAKESCLEQGARGGQGRTSGAHRHSGASEVGDDRQVVHAALGFRRDRYHRQLRALLNHELHLNVRCQRALVPRPAREHQA